MTEIITLRLLFQLGKIKFYIYPVVLKNKDNLILIDTGYPMFLPVIERAFDEKGLDITKLQQVILTHHDHDHMGAIKELITKYPKVEVKCSNKQAPYVLGQKKLLRLEQAEKIGETLEGNAKTDNEMFIHMLKSVQYIDNVTPVSDNEIICDGVKVIETPGHMPGHISIYVESEKTLISGDMLISEEGVLAIASKEFVLDEDAEIKSLKKVYDYNIEKIVCYHGGEYTSNNLKMELKSIIENGYTKSNLLYE
ncbi:Glyoxylase, beta-lactamase superfamily II [Anaerovirgula multivorans]|uniref:Glyoxylase, beta-lactamase superfamily II n=1 Tax=Anaerovirgula multivorans TaxID=312168 RepID=A0A239I790_9FIRM|nr:MBL fold metallo-hydrolase [Anaerovirgula multivorans]SNS88194.1 Glyoxylase, beta-lactamase superfamily II [Anaerovirgula multivorans]